MPVGFFSLLSGALTTSQFPVFTLYVQKNCLKISPVTDPAAESVTDSRGALRINVNGQRSAQRPAVRPAQGRAEPVGANTICSRAWSFERVQGFELETAAKRRRRVATRQACEELCLGEKEFTCRSVAHNAVDGGCRDVTVNRKSIERNGDNSKQRAAMRRMATAFPQSCISQPIISLTKL